MAVNKARTIAGILGTNSLVSYDSDLIETSYNKGPASSSTGTMSVYSSIDSLPGSAEEGTKALITSTNTLYIYSGGWYKIAIINNFNPQWITQPNSTYDLAINGTATSITVLASDSDDVPITYTATADSDFNQIATVTHDSDKHNTWTIIPTDSENGTAIGGTGTITFRASDGVNLVSAVSTFSLTFGPDWSATPTETIIRASDPDVLDRFGNSLSISSDGTYAIVGAYLEDTGGGNAGAAYIFSRSGSTWTQQQKIQSSDIAEFDQFGQSVSINSDGTYAIVGAYLNDEVGTNSGAAYIFTRSGSTWTQQQKLISSDLESGDELGYSVSINSDGTYAVVTAPDEDHIINDAGAAYIFTRSGSTWTQQAKIITTDTEFDRFGNSVSINSDGSYIIVGCANQDTGGSNTGAAYIFSRSGSTWTQQQKIQASDLQASDLFGISVDISSDGTYAIVGAYLEDTGATDAGAAYIYSRSGSTWTQQQKIQASDAQASDQFGWSVSINSDGTYAVVGAKFEDSGAAETGAAYVFERSGSTWTEIKKLTASDAQIQDQFGYSIDINSDGTYVIVGAWGERGGPGDPVEASGAAYIYEAG